MLLHVTPDGVVVGLTPPDAEGVPGWVGKHGEALLHSYFAAHVELDCAQFDRARTSLHGALDVEVEMNLLWLAVWPRGLDVPRRALDPHDPATLAVDDVVPIAVGENPSPEHACPEGAFGVQVRGVKDHDLSDQFHRSIIAEDEVLGGQLGDCTDP